MTAPSPVQVAAFVGWTDSTGQVQPTVYVLGAEEVPNPDIPVVILLHGTRGGIYDMSDPATSPGFALDITAPIVGTMDRGFHSYPNVGFWGFNGDAPLSPVPDGWQPFLISQGYLTLNYAQVDPTGSLAAPVNRQASDPVRQLEFIVQNVQKTFPGRRISFVTHSRGGLLLRAWMANQGLDQIPGQMGTVVQLAAPNQGSNLANIAEDLHASVEILQGLSAVFGIGWLDDPLLQLIDGQVGTPDMADMQTGDNNTFLEGLASAETSYVKDPPFALHTFGGTNPTVNRCHLWEFTPGSAWPLLTWNGSGWQVSFDWVTWDAGLPVRDFAGDLGVLSGIAEILPGTGDILVAAESARLPWAALHHVNPVSHAQVLWDTSVQSQGLQVLQAGRGEPAPPSPVGASWFQWTQPTRVDPGSQFSITVTVTNVGTTSWTPAYVVGADDGSGGKIWGTATSPLPSSLERGGFAQVSVSLTAPATGGSSPQNLDFYIADSGTALQRGQAPRPLLVETSAAQCQALESQWRSLETEFTQLQLNWARQGGSGTAPGSSTLQEEMAAITSQMAADGCPPPTPS